MNKKQQKTQIQKIKYNINLMLISIPNQQRKNRVSILTYFNMKYHFGELCFIYIRMNAQ